MQPRYFAHPEHIDERTGKASIVAAPAHMADDLKGRAFVETTKDEYEAQEAIGADTAAPADDAGTDED